MGKDFIPLKENGIDVKSVLKQLKTKNILFPKNVLSASQEKYFYVLPDDNDIDNIQIGTDGTDETVLRLNNGDFIELKGTIKLKEVI